MTLPRKAHTNNHFQIAARALLRDERLFEFEFKDYDEFINHDKIHTVLERHPDFHQFSILQNTRSWMTEYGRKTKTFYTAILEHDRGWRWHVFGTFGKDVKDMPKFDKRGIYEDVQDYYKELA